MESTNTARPVTQRLLLLVVLWFGCAEGDTDDEDTVGDFSAQVSADASELAERSLEAADLATRVPGPGAREGATQCYDAWGTCQFCWTADGGPLTGTVTAGLDSPPCTDGVSRGSASATYSVDLFSLDGTYSGTPAQGGVTYTVSLTGSREASLEITGRSRGGVYEASWDLTGLQATVLDQEVVDLSLSLQYLGFGGHSWDIELSGTPEAMTGSGTRDDGLGCTASGALGDLTVECAAAE